MYMHGLRRNARSLRSTPMGIQRAFQISGFLCLPIRCRDYLGPLAGVLAGLEWAAEEGADAIVTAAADTPFLPRDLWPGSATRRHRRRSNSAGRLSGRAGSLATTPPSVCACRLREDLHAELSAGFRKIMLWAERHGTATALFASGAVRSVFNVNTPAGWCAPNAISHEIDIDLLRSSDCPAHERIGASVSFFHWAC